MEYIVTYEINGTAHTQKVPIVRPEINHPVHIMGMVMVGLADVVGMQTLFAATVTKVELLRSKNIIYP